MFVFYFLFIYIPNCLPLPILPNYLQAEKIQGPQLGLGREYLALKLWEAGSGGAERLASQFQLIFHERGVGRTKRES